MKRILLLLVLCLNISMVLGQEYKNWEKYDIEGFYIIAKSKAEAKISKNVLSAEAVWITVLLALSIQSREDGNLWEL